MSSEMGALCREMRGSIDRITMEWVRRVGSDPYLHSDDGMPLSQIIDHVPQMLEELCSLMTHEEAAEPDFRTVRAASSHGYTRSLAGYSLPDLLRELEILRDCVFNFVAETETEHGVSRSEAMRALRMVNHYFGEDIIFVVENYLRRSAGARVKSD